MCIPEGVSEPSLPLASLSSWPTATATCNKLSLGLCVEWGRTGPPVVPHLRIYGHGDTRLDGVDE